MTVFQFNYYNFNQRNAVKLHWEPSDGEYSVTKILKICLLYMGEKCCLFKRLLKVSFCALQSRVISFKDQL